MKNLNTFLLLISSGLISSSLALEQPESHLRRPEIKDDREMWLFGSPETRCARQVALYEAKAGLSDLPFNQWIKTLDALSQGEANLYSDLRTLVVHLSLVDLSAMEENMSMTTTPATSAIVDIQDAVTDITQVSLESSEGSAAQFEGLIQTAIDLIATTTGMDAFFLEEMVALAMTVMDSFSQGPDKMFEIIGGAVMKYAVPILTRMITNAISGGSTTSAQYSLCAKHLHEYEFAQLVATTVPALMSGVFVAEAYAQQQAALEEATP